MFDTLLLRPSLHCNTPLNFTTLHHTLPNYTSLYFATLQYCKSVARRTSFVVTWCTTAGIRLDVLIHSCQFRILIEIYLLKCLSSSLCVIYTDRVTNACMSQLRPLHCDNQFKALFTDNYYKQGTLHVIKTPLKIV